MNYLLSRHDHTGEERSVQPEVIEGSPTTTIDIINSISRVHKYVSGVVAFRNEERPGRDQIHEVIGSFHATFLPGLDRDRYNALWVLHQDKGNMELHFVFPMADLATGRRLNIHPPGRKNLEMYECFTQVMNHSLGYAQVRADPYKAFAPDYERKTGKTEGKRQCGVLMDEIRQAVVSERVNNRDELCRFLDEGLGVTVTRQGQDYLSVKLPGAAKAVRLKGELFQEDADYRTLRDAKSGNAGPVMLTGPEFETAKAKLQALVQERHDYNIKMFQPRRWSQIQPSTIPASQSVGGRVAHVPLPSAQPRTITTQGGNTMGHKQKITSKPAASKADTQALITDVKSQVTKAEAGLSSKFTPPSKTMVRANIGIARNKALNANGGIKAMGLESMALIDAAIIEVNLSIDAANAQLRDARTPEEEARARDLLWKLQEQMRRLQAELQRIKGALQPSQSKPKL
uniref:relaxase/mobilization nuclease domain-containing protein n=1 Tax=Hylemonella sp. TaxID=2066020 RepID=UPI0035B1F4C3